MDSIIQYDPSTQWFNLDEGLEKQSINSCMHVSATVFINIYVKNPIHFLQCFNRIKKNLNMSYQQGPQVIGSKEMWCINSLLSLIVPRKMLFYIMS